MTKDYKGTRILHKHIIGRGSCETADVYIDGRYAFHTRTWFPSMGKILLAALDGNTTPDTEEEHWMPDDFPKWEDCMCFHRDRGTPMKRFVPRKNYYGEGYFSVFLDFEEAEEYAKELILRRSPELEEDLTDIRDREEAYADVPSATHEELCKQHAKESVRPYACLNRL